MDRLLQDLRLALRRLGKEPALAALAVLTLALGIGGSTAIFSVVRGVLLAPLPFEDPERLSFLTRDGDVSIPDGVDWRAVYTPYVQRRVDWQRFGTLVVRSGVPPSALTPSVKKAVWSVDPTLPLERVATLQERRQREIGVRMALGADARDLSRLVIGRGLTLAGFGLGAGLAGAWGLGRLIESQLFGVPPADPVTFAAVAFGLLATAFLACAAPAWRATRVDPATVLRSE
jgi:predicted lysophospholipase L1 biosynthesis ABC-type transport system permease subunit